MPRRFFLLALLPLFLTVCGDSGDANASGTSNTAANAAQTEKIMADIKAEYGKSLDIINGISDQASASAAEAKLDALAVNFQKMVDSTLALPAPSRDLVDKFKNKRAGVRRQVLDKIKLLSSTDRTAAQTAFESFDTFNTKIDSAAARLSR